MEVQVLFNRNTNGSESVTAIRRVIELLLNQNDDCSLGASEFGNRLKNGIEEEHLCKSQFGLLIVVYVLMRCFTFVRIAVQIVCVSKGICEHCSIGSFV